MKKFLTKMGTVFATIALMVATLNVNSTCWHHFYQGEIPDSVQKLSKIK